MRLFFALWPPPETARALTRWAAAVQRSSGGRVTAEATIHLTLAFLGEADAVKAAGAVREVRAKAFDLAIDAAKYWRHNKIVWVGP
ncbi:MAG: RNA 2',3'-cyclic phosphodiesterase, partial [Betaproteobacteria bacterium]|nr:RNA 2',3'-cyclic phosphodiesterase [Betaproteobacteria bacterium]